MISISYGNENFIAYFVDITTYIRRAG